MNYFTYQSLKQGIPTDTHSEDMFEFAALLNADLVEFEPVHSEFDANVGLARRQAEY